MTVIAWDGHQMSSDRQAGTAYLSYPRSTKIMRMHNGDLLGVAGDAAQAREMGAWVASGADPLTFPDECRPGKTNSARAMRITKAGEILIYETGPYPMQVLGPYHAIGSGAEAALAVMILGHDATKAVEIASLVCAGVGNGIDTIEL